MDTQTNAAQRLVIDTLSLRDYFAGQYMTAAAERALSCKEYELRELFGDRGGLTREEIAAAFAYRMADEMIARRGAR